jgi:hypothetical protein
MPASLRSPELVKFVDIIRVSPPGAIPSDVVLTEALNTSIGDLRVLVIRDPRTGAIRAFDRRVQTDLFPTFHLRKTARLSESAMQDTDSGSWWSVNGKAIDGPLKDSQLREIPVTTLVWYNVMKYWMPDLEFVASAQTRPPGSATR